VLSGSKVYLLELGQESFSSPLKSPRLPLLMQTQSIITHRSSVKFMKFLVFGGGGKVSRHFARLASSEGHEVVSVIRDDSQ